MRYTVTDLGPAAQVVGISALGEVLANCYGPAQGPGTPDVWRACILGPAPGQIRLLPRLQWATHMNQRGDVVGAALDPCGDPRAAVQWHDGEFQSLDGPAGPCDPGTAPNSQATWINDQGVIVGTIVDRGITAFQSDGGARVMLPSLCPGGVVEARSINNQGQVVGTADTTCAVDASGWPTWHAYSFQGGSPRDWGNLNWSTELLAVNEVGVAVGTSPGNRGPDLAVIADSTGVRPLFPDVGYFSSLPMDISDQGTVIGSVWPSETTPGFSFAWSNGVVSDLSAITMLPAGASLGGVAAINRYEQIAATGTVNGQGRVLRLDPISPVGSPVALVLGGSFRNALGTEVAFDGRRSAGPGGLNSFDWDFGDGVTAQGAVVHHAYARPGDFMATLTVTDALGGKVTATQAVIVRASLDAASVARAAARPNQGRVTESSKVPRWPLVQDLTRQ